MDILLDKHKEIHLAKIKNGDMPTGRVIEVLGIVEDDTRNPTKVGGYVHKMETFNFVFIMKMMLKLLRMTNDVSFLLQKKDQNIVEAISLVTDVRTRLVNWRNHGWESLFEEVKSFCIENEVIIPSMDTMVTRWGKTRKGGKYQVTTDHFYRVDTFYVAIDSIVTEFDHRFNEASLEDALELFHVHMTRVEDFRDCLDIASLAKRMVELNRHTMFPTVYRLIELAMLLPVATATVERVFSAMKITKTELRNKMSDGWLNDLMVCYIERGIFKSLDLSEIKKDFQKEGRALPLPGTSRRH
ncbi:uncharacterized protein [Lolium perenne]|uniref:uncharacterized protein n=1 Tax=Lolium perenne TaxID=4522 RepID=UPI0021F62FC3|nr:uncharacterized protein LOC127328442 [Lolium perenne]